MIEEGDGSGLCCVCSKKGAFGRCLRCGLLMHHGCIQPSLPGRPQPCPICDIEEKTAEGAPIDAHPHEMEVGAPRRREVQKLVFVGLDAGSKAEVPLEGGHYPTDEEAKRQGYVDAKDWYQKAVAPSLQGLPALDVEVSIATQRSGGARGRV